MRTLVVEDNPEVARQVADALEEDRFEVDVAHNGEEGWYLGDTGSYDAVILDLGLPMLDGLTVLERWRSSGKQVPMLVLSSRDTWREKVAGLREAHRLVLDQRDAEVHHLHAVVWRDEHVFGLQVPMDDSGVVSGVHRLDTGGAATVGDTVEGRRAHG